MTAGTCGTCKHWERRDDNWGVTIRLTLTPDEPEDQRYDWDGPHAQRVRRVEQQYGECAAITLLDSNTEHDEESLPLAFAKDGSDYRATVHTRAEFGCVLWQSS